MTNDKSLQAFINEKKLDEDICKVLDQKLEESASETTVIRCAGTKVLGLKQDIESNCFAFGFSGIIGKCRNTYIVASSIFHPVGLTSPITAQIELFSRSYTSRK